jgi:hypothetical protein
MPPGTQCDKNIGLMRLRNAFPVIWNTVVKLEGYSNLLENSSARSCFVYPHLVCPGIFVLSLYMNSDTDR